MNKILSVLLLFLTVTQTTNAQKEFKIIRFEEDVTNTAAQEEKYREVDSNNHPYAIMKVKEVSGNVDMSKFTFSFGHVNNKIKMMPNGERWEYVQRSAKQITVNYPGYKSVERYDLGMTIQSGHVYILTIAMEDQGGLQKEILKFQVDPISEKSVIKVRPTNSNTVYESWGEVDANGSKDRYLELGKYDYQVITEGYLESYGQITLDEPNGVYTENVKLIPNFGFLEVDNTYGIAGAEIYVNDKKIGTVPYTDKKRWDCGNYNITIMNGELYKPFNGTFTIEQDQTTRLSPKLESNFAETTLRVEADADIYIDGVKKGTRTWTGPLKAGKYLITCKQESHKETNKSVTIQPDFAETFLLEEPVPITGNLYVSTTPSGATITIDGKNVGVTPKVVSDILIGSHTVSLTLANHKTETKTVEIKEGQTEEWPVTMSDMARMTIASNPQGATLFINGKAVGQTPYTADMASGDYEIKMTKEKYKDYIRKEHLDSSNPNVNYSLTRQYVQKNSFYLQPSFQAGSCMAVGASLGGYISNINVEAIYLLGMTESEEIFWNATDKDERPSSYTYKTTVIGGRIGYGVICGSRLRITPQIGAGCVQMKGTAVTNNSSSFIPEQFYAINATVGCKFDFALASGIGLFVAPEYSTAVNKSNYFKDVEPISSKIKGFATGINVRAGLSLFF